MRFSLILAFLSCCSVVRADVPAMEVGTIVEERFRESDEALVVPARLELSCKTSGEGPWGFSFAGFETRWKGPFEIEVSGSGGYAGNDVYSIAALSVDYGVGGKWVERSLFGLGLIQNVRLPHPPGWGVGTNGKIVMRGNLLKAGAEPQRVTVDLAKYAPAGWDGKIWIGVMLHNVGPSKNLTVRILNAAPAAAGKELSRKDLLLSHERAFLESAVAELKAAGPVKVDEKVAPEMQAYAAAGNLSGDDIAKDLQGALAIFDRKPPDAGSFLNFAERFFTWQHREPGPSVAEQANATLAAWKNGGEVGKEIGCIVRAATNMDKVGIADVASGRVMGKDSPPISISAARREYEGFQLVLTPLAGCSENVTVLMGGLNGDGGVIPVSEMSVNAVGYVRIYAGQNRERLVPDPLLFKQPALKAGENQPVWVTIHVPEGTKAGMYRGTVNIADAKSSIWLPVELKVRDFEIPKKISLRSSFWMFRDQLNRFYHVDEIKFDDYMKWIDFALQHRVNPIDVFEGFCQPLLDICKPTPKFDTDNWDVGAPDPHVDFTKWDAYIDRMIAGGANTLPLGTTHHFGSFFRVKPKEVGTPEHIARVVEAVKIMEDHYKARGICGMHYLQLRDEVSDDGALAAYRGVHDALPDVKLLLTAMPPKAKPLVSIPCPLSRGFDPAWRDEMHAKGNEYWWYVCLDPEAPYANLMLHESAAMHRALFWQTWSHDVDGLLYWGMNYWSGYGFKWPDGVGAQTTRIARSDWPQPISIPDHPGDGISIYPGPSIAQPMSSIRLECMRDGEEDYEYFLLLDAAIAKAQAKGDSALVKEAIATRDAAKKMVESLTDYEKSSAPYLEIREKVAVAIESLPG